MPRSTPAPPTATPVDVGRTLDEGHWSGYQRLLVLLTASAIVFDGLDLQLLGVALPSIMREWRLARPAFATVFASGLFGMMIGGAVAGLVGDRIGRRAALLGSVFVFGALTVVTAAVNDLTMSRSCASRSGGLSRECWGSTSCPLTDGARST